MRSRSLMLILIAMAASGCEFGYDAEDWGHVPRTTTPPVEINIDIDIDINIGSVNVDSEQPDGDPPAPSGDADPSVQSDPELANELARRFEAALAGNAPSAPIETEWPRGPGWPALPEALSIIADCESGQRDEDGQPIKGSRSYDRVRAEGLDAGLLQFIPATWEAVVGATDTWAALGFSDLLTKAQQAPSADLAARPVQRAAGIVLWSLDGLRPWTSSESCWADSVSELP